LTVLKAAMVEMLQHFEIWKVCTSSVVVIYSRHTQVAFAHVPEGFTLGDILRLKVYYTLFYLSCVQSELTAPDINLWPTEFKNLCPTRSISSIPGPGQP
jgi:hypothetical protein